MEKILNEKGFIIIAFFAVIIYFGAFLFFISVEKSTGDLDGRPQYSFPTHGGDSIGYTIASENLLNRGVFSLRTRAPYLPEAWRTPGFPAFAAGLKYVFGSYYAVSVAQIVLMVIAGFLIFRMGERLHSVGVGLFAAVVFLLDPASIFYSFTMLSDTLFVFLLVLSAYLFFFEQWKREWLRLLFAGALLGAATLVRPIGVFLPFVFAAFYVFLNFRKIELRKLIAAGGIMIAGSGLYIAPWMARNKIFFDSWNLSSVGGMTLYLYWLPEYLAVKEGRDGGTIQKEFINALGDVDDYKIRELKYSPHFQSVFMQYVLEDPLGYAKFHFVKTIPFFLTSSAKNVVASVVPLQKYLETGGGSSASINFTTLLLKGEFGEVFRKLEAQGIFTFEQLFWAAITLFAILAVFFEKERRKYVVVFFAIVLYFAFLAGPVSNARYRLPAEPFLLLTAAMGFMAIKMRLRAKIR